ncbi:PREDICTED: protein-tyrosine sulfotransferase isoform X2 [Nelumbo nucifera]|uniref:Protein-tyrosine sulfotransferase isoform X2 n=1 Tax=Nelumbo nucifera TaxID=4432 RepID=A0A1U7ZII4_NELNU|nr:PREDICTED: protein-tyrosine sulfotransferase isoform X2 [Nelumbo nucifera]
MAPAQNVVVLAMLLAVVFTSLNASPTEDDFLHCQRTVKRWATSSLETKVKEDKHKLQDLLFFLHIPRTGGRTYFHCFLRRLYYSSLECPRSYDKLRFDPSKPNCRLMVTHDDYSVVSKLPRGSTSVVTILRNPLDRVFSTYEFSVEVAARFLVHPNLTSATQMTGRIRPKNKGREIRSQGGFSSIDDNNDSYNMEKIVMPLHQFINDPIAHDIVHNGATLQVAGLTNNSYFAESHEVRHCISKYRSLGEYVLEVAKKRLDDMLYIGLTEDHRESATMFANVVGEQVLSQFHTLSSSMEQSNNKSELSPLFLDPEGDGGRIQNTTNKLEESEVSAENVEVAKENMTVAKLMEAYEVCISSLRKAQSRRRFSSLKRISPANFSKEARRQVPEAVLKQIMSLNSLDVELYKYAQGIFFQQQKDLMEKERQKSALSSSHAAQWKISLLVVTVLLFLVIIFLLVSARRRTSKLKI